VVTEAALSPRQSEFERSLVDVLTMDYDLRVRLASDPLERRRNGYAVLHFDYHHSDAQPGRCKVIVRVQGLDGFSTVFHVDLGNLESIMRAAERCESLALAIMDHHEDWDPATRNGHISIRQNRGRRSDD
jgi:hypothetical protein